MSTIVTSNTNDFNSKSDTVFDILKNKIHNGCSPYEINNIISINNLDLKAIVNKLLLYTATVRNEEVMDWLLIQQNHTPLRYNVDEEGRNILMLMLINNGQDLFFNYLEREASGVTRPFKKLLHYGDNKGNNVLHLAVIYKKYDILECMLSYQFFTQFLSDVYTIEKKDNIPYGLTKQGLHMWMNNDGETVRDLLLSRSVLF